MGAAFQMFDEPESRNAANCGASFDMHTLHPAAGGVPAEGGISALIEAPPSQEKIVWILDLTIERYLECKQNLEEPVNDRFRCLFLPWFEQNDAGFRIADQSGISDEKSVYRD
jgi:hypothetical protein